MPQSSTPRGGGWLGTPLGVIKFDNGRVSFPPCRYLFPPLREKPNALFCCMHISLATGYDLTCPPPPLLLLHM